MDNHFFSLKQRADDGQRWRILLVGQHVLAREGLRRSLEENPLWSVVSEAGTQEEIHSAFHHFHPDLALIDSSVPINFGAEVAHLMKAHCPTIRVVALLLEAEEPSIEHYCKPLGQ